MGAVKKAIKYTAALAIAGFAIYELSRMMKRKTETIQTDMGSYQTTPREPGDYRSIYNL
ncbi:MAG: hypothetical protein WBZ29_08165 [Methanocella sp.]